VFRPPASLHPVPPAASDHSGVRADPLERQVAVLAAGDDPGVQPVRAAADPAAPDAAAAGGECAPGGPGEAGAHQRADAGGAVRGPGAGEAAQGEAREAGEGDRGDRRGEATANCLGGRVSDTGH
jgi:hypothetical protein